MNDQEGDSPEFRESTNEEHNGDRYTKVDNDVLFNHIEGYKEEKNEEKELAANENPEKDKENNTSKADTSTVKAKEFKKLKVILLGEKDVGKTSLIDRYVSNKFNVISKSTIGDDIKQKKIEIDKTLTVNLAISDTTNEEKLGQITKNYYLDAHGAIIVFDLTNENSFKKVKFWMDELNSKGPRDVVLCLLANKADLTADRVVKYEDAKELAGDNLYYEVSAKTGNNVSLAFEQLTDGILEKQKEEENNPNKVLRGKEGRKTADLKDINKDLSAKKKCC